MNLTANMPHHQPFTFDAAANVPESSVWDHRPFAAEDDFLTHVMSELTFGNSVHQCHRECIESVMNNPMSEEAASALLVSCT